MESDSKTAQDVIYLVSCSVNGRKPEEMRVGTMDLDRVFAFASRHKVSALAAAALVQAGCKDQRAQKITAKAIRRAVIFENALEEVKKGLTEKGIWFLLLKGAVLKKYYPGFGMREFADCDILIDPSRTVDVRNLMESLGFTTEYFGSAPHDIYHKAPVLNFEMHKMLFEPEVYRRFYEYYSDVESRLCGAGCEKSFTPEDLYLYLLAHEYKHYSGGGTGLRSLLDTYVFLKSEKLDMEYIASESEKLGIREFEEKNRSLSMHLFSENAMASGSRLTEMNLTEAKLTVAEREMLDYILGSGVYGTVDNRVKNQMKKNHWTVLQYIRSRFCVPVSRADKSYDAFADMYPVFYKYKILLPLLPFYRIFRAAKAGRFRREWKAVLRSTSGRKK